MSMKYQCTRDKQERVTASQAILHGISATGGLYVPDFLPKYNDETLLNMQDMDYMARAARILRDFLDDYSDAEIEDCVRRAYLPEKFGGKTPAPLVRLPYGEQSVHMLELWHGPTCAFKDMALQLLPQLLVHAMKKADPDKTALILTATSGDTGKAALEGFCDVDGTRIMVFYPENGVSEMQKRQMNTQKGENVSVCAVQGNFDDVQTSVKQIFVDDALKARLRKENIVFSSANSINWGRLVAQIVYYFSAYCDLMKQGELSDEGEKINIVVPTGNFGNILAAYYAVKMGLPVNRLICASNSNNVLTEFLSSGTYNRNRTFYTTMSPSMDILISSNLERMLFDMSDAAQVSSWMQELAETGKYEVTDEILQEIKTLFSAGYCGEAETAGTIRRVYETAGYLCDPHTAVAVHVYDDYVARTGDRHTPTVIVSTASPYKFARDVLHAIAADDAPQEDPFADVERLQALTGAPAPASILQLRGEAVRFQNSCVPQEMREKVVDFIGI